MQGRSSGHRSSASQRSQATPPIQAIRIIFSLLLGRRLCRGGKSLKVWLFDIERAHSNASETTKFLQNGFHTDAYVDVWDPRCRSQQGDGVHFMLNRGRLGARHGLVVCHGDDVYATGDEDRAWTILRPSWRIGMRSKSEQHLGSSGADRRPMSDILEQANREGARVHSNERFATS